MTMMTTMHDGRCSLGGRWAGVLVGMGLLLMGCVSEAEAPVPASPRSLVGVDIDGILTVSEGGDFVFDRGARAFFDHFVAAEGEVDDAALEARVRMEIERRLEPAAVTQAFDAYLDYLEYRRRLSALAQDYVDINPERASESMMESMVEIRAQTIGDAPGVPDEAPTVRAALAMRRALQDPELDSEARGRAVTRIREQLGHSPNPRAPSRVLLRLHEALEPIAFDDIEARRAVLVREVGAAAAERWLAMERTRGSVAPVR